MWRPLPRIDYWTDFHHIVHFDIPVPFLMRSICTHGRLRLSTTGTNVGACLCEHISRFLRRHTSVSSMNLESSFISGPHGPNNQGFE
jgi:hypothetical protein